MKNQSIKKLIFLLFISLNAIAQDGKFSFKIPSPITTSAGVFKDDSILIKTLWNNVNYNAGTYTKYWDGTDDYGVKIASPASSYKIKVMTNNVQYEWQGTIGNTSTSMTGGTKHRGYYNCMKGLAFGSGFGYFCTGYSEGSAARGKFALASPNQKLIFGALPGHGADNADVNYVATDGTKVYWGVFDSNAGNNSFVFGTNTSDDAEVAFAGGTPYTVVYGRSYPYSISRLDQANSNISGLAVQKSGNYLFVARSGLNQLQVLNKTTGALVQTLSYNTPRGLSVDGGNNLWMASGTNSVAKFTVNGDGTLTAATLTLSGLLDPRATQVSFDGALISVADGSTSQQVKFYNSNTGAVTNTLGAAGGYVTDATVTDNKFYFNDINGPGVNQYNKLPFIAYQPDNSFWVNDPGNFRMQHYNSSRVFLNRVMSLGANYSVFVDKNNINKVFSEMLEFEIDYSVQTLTGSNGWILKKNWGANISTATYDGPPSNQTTLSNGRTYGFLRKRNYTLEIVEFPSSGQLRFTGTFTNDLANVLCTDGSKQTTTESGNTITVRRYPLTGFDGSANPIWSTTGEFLASGLVDNVVGSPVNNPNSQMFSSTNKIVFFNPKAYANNTGPIFSTGYHLGLMQIGAANSFLFQTEKSTHRDYVGDYPKAGWFDEGNKVSDFAGGNVNIMDRNIITSYHGEFWKDGQTNKYNHYYDNGLAIGQFGTTRPEVGFGNHAAAMMAGNAITPSVVKDANGDLYLWHGDESDHAAVHRWKITGLNTIAEQVINISFPSVFNLPVGNYTDLMVGLPFNATLQNNTAGWTRNPTSNIIISQYNNNWIVKTSVLKYEKLNNTDLYIQFAQPGAQTYNVSRDLGTNNITNDWKISGSAILSVEDGALNGEDNNAYIEVLDDAGKVLTTFYAITNKSAYPVTVTKVYCNAVELFSMSDPAGSNITHTLNPFEIKIDNGIVTFNYAGYTANTTISDATGNWKKPKTLRFRFASTGSIQNYSVRFDVSDLKFYKDNSAAVPPNQIPVANAGNNKVITLPVNNVTLSGSGTDVEGTISSYAWLKISGPSAGTIGTANAATTSLNNLVQGVYEYELTVTDNSGATGKDTVQVTVNAAANQAPAANAGVDKTITLPINSITLIGNGSDADGTISGYVWVKISGPSSGTIATANAATTVINNLVQGIYKYELTVTDNNGTTAKDTVQVTVNTASNQPPAANAGVDRTITLPVNSITLIGNGTDADGTISIYAWVKISGPTSGTIATPNALATAINSLVQGVYKYELTVTDNNGATAKDTVQVIVNAAANVNQLPIAKAGADYNIVLPTNFVLLNGSGSDQDGIIVTYSWRVINGPVGYTFVSPQINNTKIENLFQGIYNLELTVKDNDGATARDTLTITVSSPRLSNYTTNAFTVYPNPVRDVANLNITTVNGKTKLSVSVVDVRGRLVKYQEMVTSYNDTLIKMDMSNLSDGYYIISVRFDDGKKVSTKIIKYGGK